MNKASKYNSSLEKLNFFIKNDLVKKKNLNILEFGVHAGISTKLFLKIIKKNKGKLISVDTVNYKSRFKDKNWLFLNCRDDNFKYISKYINHLLQIFPLLICYLIMDLKNVKTYYLQFNEKFF